MITKSRSHRLAEQYLRPAVRSFQEHKTDNHYNVHSYYAEDSSYTLAKCNYGIEYAAAIGRSNFYGLQFHTEKSAGVGEQILKNFK
jgi:glutamine amidotransferase